jgi:hypothetical protein
LHKKNQEEPTSAFRTSIKEKTKQLMAKLKPEQPFTAVARQCLIISGIPWAQAITNS